MKNGLSQLAVISFAFCQLLTVNLFAQAPKKMSYQGAVRDVNGAVLMNKDVTLKLHIISEQDIDNPVYTEVQTATTNTFGLINLKIGEGQAFSGSMDNVSWGDADHFIAVELDAENNGHFVQMGVSQLLSVPYAFYAEKAGTAKNVENDSESRAIDFGGTTGQTIRHNGSDWEASSLIYSGTNNVGIGTTSPGSKLDVNGNVNLSSGSEITFAGARALYMDASRNLIQGEQAGEFLTSGSNNNIIGYQAGRNNSTGSNNLIIGYRAGLANTTGSSNAFVGYRAGHLNTVGSNNFYGGLNAGYGATSGLNNIALGTNSGFSLGSGKNNAFIGRDAGRNTVGVNDNVFIGYQAGIDNTTGASNTYIGSGADGDNGQSYTNATAIGANTKVAADNAVVLGNNANVGIGTGAPGAKLHVVGDVRIVDGNQGSGKVLTSDANGVASWQTPSGGGVNTLDEAYDQGGMGAGKMITADSGAVHIGGEDGLMVTGTFGSGDIVSVTGAGTRMFFNPRKSAFRAGTSTSALWDNDSIGNYSAATGFGTLASGDYSMASGIYSTARGDNSTAVGYNAFGGGVSSFASGHVTVAAGDHSTAMGYLTDALGDNSTAIGNLANASGDNSVSIGFNTESDGEYATAIGYNTDGAGYSSTAIGNNTKANATYSTALGKNSTANGNSSMAMGYYITAPSFAETVIGSYNTDYTPSSTSTFASTDRLFVIGNGTGSGAKSDAMVLLKNGNTGIGTSTPGAKLHVVGDVQIVDGNQSNGKVLTSDANGVASWQTPSVGSSNTLDGAYDEGGKGAGRMITADSGAVHISGEDGLKITGAYGSGEAINESGAGTRFMFNPLTSSLRAGTVSDTQWNVDSVGDYSIGLGYDAKATNNYSTAIGRNVIASGQYSTAIGDGARALGEGAVGIGSNADAIGHFSFASGSGTNANNPGSVAMGVSSNANGYGAVAIGVSNYAYGDRSLALGDNSAAYSYAETVLGRWSEGYVANSTTTWDAADRILAVGNGTGAGSRSNAMVILKNGNIGIGTDSPVQTLHVQDGLLVTGTYSSGDDVNVSGAGARMFFNPKKAAFRAGYAGSSEWNNDSIGDFSVAMGYGTKATGEYSTALGSATTAKGSNSFVGGYSSTASGSGTVALGYISTASGDYSTALGNNSTASGDFSTSLGSGFSVASGRFSSAFGGNTEAKSGYETVMGRYNTDYTPTSISGWSDSDRLFVIGNGTSSGTKSDALMILKNGNTGIGTSTPQQSLHLVDGFLITGTYGSGDSVNISGAGTRMFFNPKKAALRAGYVNGAQWNIDSIGDYSVALGYNVKATGDNSVALGISAEATNLYSFAGGHGSKASGYGATALGFNTTASNYYATSMGFGSVASGSYSTTMGINSEASGTFSTAIGDNATAKSGYEIALGRYNTDYTPNNTNDWNSSDRLLVVGNGTSSGSRSDAMVILKNGNIGIGTSTPSQLLELSGSGGVDGIKFPDGTTQTTAYTGGGGNTLDEAYDEGGLGAGRTITATNGEVTIAGTDGLLITGNYNFGASISATGSGSRLIYNPRKAAFRAGYASVTAWDDSNVGQYSTALGYAPIASGEGAVAMGFGSEATGDYSVSGGYATIASGANSTAFGAGDTASGSYATAMGYLTKATGNYSAAFGFNTHARSYGEVAIGLHNTDQAPISTTSYNSEDRLFSIGNGTNNASKSNAMVVLKNGRTGLGTNTPTQRLHVYGGLLAYGFVGAGDTVTITGASARMFFNPRKAAFRAGYVGTTQWNNANIGNYSIAMGHNTIANNTYAVALGRSTIASGDNSTAMGYNTEATGQYSFAVGQGASATGGTAVAMGYNVEADGLYSFAQGTSTDATGSNSVAMGAGSIASGQNSTAMGVYSTASGSYTFAEGSYIEAPSGYETVIGRYNTTYTPTSTTGWNSSDRLFVVGNGTSSGAKSDALIVYKDGDITTGGDLTLGGEITQDSWTAPAMMNNWANYGGAYETLGYYKDKEGVVHLKGLVVSGTSSVVFILPVGYRPTQTRLFATLSDHGTGYVVGGVFIYSNGNVQIQNYSGANYTSFSGVSFSTF